jgi:PRTRC genetic system protein C
MAITIQKVARQFSFNGVDLPDPGENFTPEEVRDVYSAQYPDISTAIIEAGEVTATGISYKFVRNVGTKG